MPLLPLELGGSLGGGFESNGGASSMPLIGGLAGYQIQWFIALLSVSNVTPISLASLDVKDLNSQNLDTLNLEDGCATLSMLTVSSICMALDNFENRPNLILLSGGGRKNKYIFDNIRKKFRNSVKLIDDFNFNGDFIESQAFAYLAIRSYLKKIITFPSTTGVKKPCLGGSIFKS